MNKSKCKKIKDIDFTSKIIITKLQISQNEYEEHLKRLRSLFKDASEEDIQKRLHNIVVRENKFNEIMNLVVPCFEFEINDEELNKNIENLSNHFKDQPRDFVEKLGVNIIKKTLIFQFLAEKWEIKTTDEEVDKSLQNFYKMSNQSIREYYNDKEKFENIRKVMTDEKILASLLRRFEGWIDLDLKQPEKGN